VTSLSEGEVEGALGDLRRFLAERSSEGGRGEGDGDEGKNGRGSHDAGGVVVGWWSVKGENKGLTGSESWNWNDGVSLESWRRIEEDSQGNGLTELRIKRRSETSRGYIRIS
jgi:hypothetical protein